MNPVIRNFHDRDFETITSWWKEHGELPPLPGMMISDGTFVLEIDKTPLLSLTVFLTQSREVAYFEGYVSKPGIEKTIRKKLGALLFQHAFQFAKARGYKRLLIYTNKEKLAERYEELGMTRSPVSGLRALWKEL